MRYLFAALACSAALAATAVPAHAATRAPAVEIDRIWYDSPGPDYRGDSWHARRALNGEYVVVKNNTRRTIDLAGWTLSDASRHRFTFPRRSYVRPGRSVVVRTGIGRDTWTTKYQDRRAYVWNNTSDVGTLRTPRGFRMDVCSYNNSRRDYTNC